MIAKGDDEPSGSFASLGEAVEGSIGGGDDTRRAVNAIAARQWPAIAGGEFDAAEDEEPTVGSRDTPAEDGAEGPGGYADANTAAAVED